MAYSINYPQLWRWNIVMQRVGQFVMNRQVVMNRQAPEVKPAPHIRPISATAAQLQRIVLANQPRLLREMLAHVFAATPGLQVVVALDDGMELSDVIGSAQANWVVVSLGGDSWEPIQALSKPMAGPMPSLLAISADGKQVEVHTPAADGSVQSYSFYDISLANLLEILA
jgi:hypothetical protein